MTLTIQDLGALGELLGSVAVLATLVYLALQTRQNTLAISAQLDAARIEASLRIGLTAATSNELGEAIREDSTVDRTINELRLGAYWTSLLTSMTSLLTSMEWQLHQARRGLLLKQGWQDRPEASLPSSAASRAIGKAGRRTSPPSSSSGSRSNARRRRDV